MKVPRVKSVTCLKTRHTTVKTRPSNAAKPVIRRNKNGVADMSDHMMGYRYLFYPWGQYKFKARPEKSSSLGIIKVIFISILRANKEMSTILLAVSYRRSKIKLCNSSELHARRVCAGPPHRVFHVSLAFPF
jgi:hypothetical protein